MNIPFGEHVISWRDISYRVIRRLGTPGGTSTVFLALATSGALKGITCAVKVFHKLDREQWRMNFMREANFMRSCDHPAIMPVLDEGVHAGKNPFIVMDYLPSTLADKVGQLTDEERINCVMQLLSAVNYLSHMDPPIVHRDIKPKNIFLKAGSCVLGDFGLLLRIGDVAKVEPPGDDLPRVPEMAVPYRTPELVAYHKGGPEPSPKSDVFQLGLVAAELFTGRNPLSGGSLDSIELDAVEVNGPYGIGVTALIHRMLAINPDDRPTAAEALAGWQEQYWSVVRNETLGVPRKPH